MYNLNVHFAGDGVGVFPGLVEDFAFQNGQDIEQGDIYQHTGGNTGHIVAGDVGLGQSLLSGCSA